MKDFLKKVLPRPVWASLKGTFYGIKAIQLRTQGRHKFTGETTKAVDIVRSLRPSTDCLTNA